MKSLGEILDRGLYHSALEVDVPDAQCRRLTRHGHGADRRADQTDRHSQALESALEDKHRSWRSSIRRYAASQRASARRRAARTCTLSAHSGLPALAVPAGFSADGLPVGIDLLGGAFKEAQLLSIGLGVQQTLALRRPPFSTPALVDGKPPAPTTGSAKYGDAIVSIMYDQTTSRMTYAVTGSERNIAQLGAVWIGTGTPAKPGALRHRLLGPGLDANGVVLLTFRDREDLDEGQSDGSLLPANGSKRGRRTSYPAALTCSELRVREFVARRSSLVRLFERRATCPRTTAWLVNETPANQRVKGSAPSTADGGPERTTDPRFNTMTWSARRVTSSRSCVT